MYDSISGIEMGTKEVSLFNGTIPNWDISVNPATRSDVSNFGVLNQFWTHAFWIRWRESETNWRSLAYYNSHAMIVESGSGRLGLHHGSFIPAGDAVIKREQWSFVVQVGDLLEP